MKQQKKSWVKTLLSFAEPCKGKMILSVLCAIFSVAGGFIPFWAVYKILLLFINRTATGNDILLWCLVGVGGYLIRVLCFGISTILAHISAYTILEGIRLKIANRLMKAPLGEVMRRRIGYLKNIIMDKVEDLEPPLAHVIPELTSNLLLPLADLEKTTAQGVNGAAFALLALDCGGYELPQNSAAAVQATRDGYVDAILTRQNADGGWSLGGGASDPDLTAMALRALARYRSRADVSAAVEAGLSCLSQMQEENGAFSSWGTESSESVSQVLTALTELGLSLDDARFVKNGQTLEDVLLRFAQDDGSFAHTPEDGGNLLATTQAFYALTALQRARDGKPTLYDMSDVTP